MNTIKDLNNQELMAEVDYWLNHPEHHWQVDSYIMSFMSSVNRYWKKEERISQRQRLAVERILMRHKK